jgi:hypothetical protein
MALSDDGAVGDDEERSVEKFGNVDPPLGPRAAASEGAGK